MRFETINGVAVPKIGYGTWKIGGHSSANRALDSKSLTALRYALEIGYTHFDTAEMYASGHAEELLGQAVRESDIPRENLFIASKVQPHHLQYDDVLRSCENSLHRLQMDYLDLYLIHWPAYGMRLEGTFRALNKLVHDGKIKHVGVSNFNLKLLKESQGLSENPILTDQVPYSLSERSYVQNRVLEYCQRNNILLTAYSPMNEGNLRSNKTLEAIASTHSVTPYQIALAWLAMQSRVITIPMSFNPQHIQENFESANIELTREEFEALDQL
jgi:diketogulonate reductase-like aldo/keto reductase